MNTAIRDGRDQRRLGILVLVLAVLQLGLALGVVPRFAARITPLYGIGAADNWLSIAKNIDAGQGYRFTPQTSLTLMREPGYPYFLAGLLRVFDNDHEAAIVANILFTALAALLVGHLARALSRLRWLPMAAAILFMIHPAVILSELRGGIESLFTLLALVFLAFLLGALDEQKTSGYVKAGLALGVASCVRSTALLFPVCLIIFGLLRGEGLRSVPRYSARAALVLACALLVLSPWIIRNELLVGKFVPTASVQGVAMQSGEYLCVHAGEKDMDLLDLDAAKVRNRIAAGQGYRFQGDYYQFFYDPKDEVKFNNSLGRQVVADYLQSPRLFMKCAARNVFKFWFAGKSPAVTVANLCIQLPYLVLALIGAALEYRRMDRTALTLLALFVAYTMAVYVPMHAQARYAVPLIPILALFAAVPLCRFALRRRAAEPTPAPHPSTSE
jgi:4-amino-4-deoxy-L-arabinose transferase-like glycosyltransferase